MTTTSTHNFWLRVFHEILDDIESKFSNTLCVHNIAAKIIWGSKTTCWDESRLLASNITHPCVTPQGGLWPGRPCLVYTLMTLWLGLSPICADHVKNRHQCRKVAPENTIKTMHLIMFSPLVLRDFNHRHFPNCYSVFLQLFFILLIAMATLSEMLCFLSTEV